MNTKKISLLMLVLFVSTIGSGCGYNTLQSKQQGVKARWADVESQIQRRADLIPNLFEAAKAAGIQEQEVFGTIAQARSQLLNARISRAKTGCYRC
jgi:LemA protein